MSYCGKINSFEELWNSVKFGHFFWGGGVVSDLKRAWSRDTSLPRALLIPNN